MPINFVRSTYDGWIKRNQPRFKYSPVIIKEGEDYFVLAFTGVATELTCCIREDGRAEIFIHDSKGQYWDIVADFDVVVNQNNEGKYYCSLCIEPTYYLTRYQLWEDHIFEELLSWVNENVTPDTLICLYGRPEKTSYGADLVKGHNYDKDFYVHCFPILI